MKQATPMTIDKLLQDLQSTDAYIRKTAAEEMGKLNSSDDRVLSALKTIADSDDNKLVRSTAKQSYLSLGGQEMQQHEEEEEEEEESSASKYLKGEIQMLTYKFPEELLGRRRLFAVVALIVTVGVIWMAFNADDIVNRIGFGVFGILSGLTTLNLGIQFLNSNPTITISENGINVNGYYPADNPNNWARELNWSEIGIAKMVTKENKVQGGGSVTIKFLSFYDKTDAEKVVGTIAQFLSFENQDDIAQVISQQLGQPIKDEIIKEVK